MNEIIKKTIMRNDDGDSVTILLERDEDQFIVRSRSSLTFARSVFRYKDQLTASDLYYGLIGRNYEIGYR